MTLSIFPCSLQPFIYFLWQNLFKTSLGFDTKNKGNKNKIKWDNIKLNCTAQETISKTAGQPTAREQIANRVSGKGLLSTTHEELTQLSSKQPD